jgi:hypothetical protein
MWSLGVEEQFYLLFPILLILLQFFRRGTLTVVITLVALSFVGNMAALDMNRADAAFFLIPFRAWELGCGAALAIWLQQGGGPSTPRPVAAVLGAILLAVGLAGVNLLESMNAPIALAAVAGTTMLIWANHGANTSIGNLLATRPVVFIGLISYSLYLWHWPLIVMPRYYLVRDLTLWEGSLAVSGSIIMAAFSWRYIERPFRQRSMATKKVIMTTLVASLVTIAVGLIILIYDGLPGRLSERVATINAAVNSHYRCPVTSYIQFGGQLACPIELPDKNPRNADTILFGNSHAVMYAPAVAAALASHDRHGLLVATGGCLPSIDANVSVKCDQIMRANLAAIADLPNARTVIVAFDWPIGRNFVDGTGKPLDGGGSLVLAAGIGRAIEQLHAAGKEVILVGPIAYPGQNVTSQISRNLAFGRPIEEEYLWTSQAEFEAQHSKLIAALSQLSGVELLRPHTVQCRDGRCYFVDGDEALFSDGSGHLASTALGRFVPIFIRGLD